MVPVNASYIKGVEHKTRVEFCGRLEGGKAYRATSFFREKPMTGLTVCVVALVIIDVLTAPKYDS